MVILVDIALIISLEGFLYLVKHIYEPEKVVNFLIENRDRLLVSSNRDDLDFQYLA